MKERYKETDPNKIVNLAFDYKEKLTRYFELKENIKQLETMKKQIENELKNELKDAEIGITKGYKVTWKHITQNRVDNKLLQEKFPDVYKQVLKQTQYRKFDVKEID